MISSMCASLFSSITDNQITSIPESIGNLAHLERLYLNGMNDIFDVCMQLFSSITENRIASIPESIVNLVNLEWLHLSGMNDIFV
jgi:Leucine-rich repeat (LRR) protein